MDDAPLTEVAANVRHSLIGVLLTFASPESQRLYDWQARVNVAGELCCQWADDVYHPDGEAFLLAFDARERKALAAFDAVFQRESAALSPAPSVEEFIASHAGKELANAANLALQALGVTAVN